MYGILGCGRDESMKNGSINPTMRKLKDYHDFYNRKGRFARTIADVDPRP
jgi:hypothetical protein